MRDTLGKIVHFLRRVVVGLGLFAVLIFMTLVLIMPKAFGESLETVSVGLRLLVAALIDAAYFGLMYLQIRRRPAPPSDAGLEVRMAGMIAHLDIESAKERILKAIRELSDVVSADATIKSLHGKADIELRVEISSQAANLPDKEKEIDRALKQVVNKQLGLQMAGRARVRLRFPSGLSVPVSEPAKSLQRIKPSADLPKSSEPAVPVVSQPPASSPETSAPREATPPTPPTSPASRAADGDTEWNDFDKVLRSLEQDKAAVSTPSPAPDSPDEKPVAQNHDESTSDLKSDTDHSQTSSS